MGSSAKKQEAVRRYVRSRAPRMQWTAELHRSFLQAIECLGGEHNATPKLVLKVMGVKELTISHVKSHLQMYRGPSTRKAKREAQPGLQRRHSCAADEQGGAPFMCPPLKRARTGAGTEAAGEGMQGGQSQGISGMKTSGAVNPYCIDDYYMQAMAMERRIMEGLSGWQRDAAAAAAVSDLRTVGCLEQGSGDFKIIKPEAHHYYPGLAVKKQGPKEKDGNGTEQCSLSLSLGLDPRCLRAAVSSSSPSEGSCIVSSSPPPRRRSSSHCSGHSGYSDTQGVNLDLSLSICGSY
ncbi:unnamed protein product [Triticum aestivum]|uniref:Myb-like domain-containing protein n=2 Tax=Triticum aestivum TaxID=4565 RepID=A0A9R1EWI2_WHEAT|nr:myb family transcription factor MOF1-like isoform X2 [Triticum aestivum]KAF7017738.1 hypothetical protein CFC21_031133 [Triticum aestivum]SPT19413.1 unnamed protein product [Triticum aestivum]